MLILLSGDTWYGKYGFRPYKDNYDINRYEKNIEIMNNITISDANILKYIKLTKKEDIPFDKLHDRRRGTANNIKQKVTGAGYKWDFKINEVLAVKKY